MTANGHGLGLQAHGGSDAEFEAEIYFGQLGYSLLRRGKQFVLSDGEFSCSYMTIDEMWWLWYCLLPDLEWSAKGARRFASMAPGWSAAEQEAVRLWLDDLACPRWRQGVVVMLHDTQQWPWSVLRHSGLSSTCLEAVGPPWTDSPRPPGAYCPFPVRSTGLMGDEWKERLLDVGRFSLGRPQVLSMALEQDILTAQSRLLDGALPAANPAPCRRRL